ncbi:hypothetical protein BJY52DRAFT_1221866 [Lactarius psammicola]|nr:hypothetical protein BJY52DRAFT_1221866 [Lactarius psammicola]
MTTKDNAGGPPAVHHSESFGCATGLCVAVVNATYSRDWVFIRTHPLRKPVNAPDECPGVFTVSPLSLRPGTAPGRCPIVGIHHESGLYLALPVADGTPARWQLVAGTTMYSTTARAGASTLATKDLQKANFHSQKYRVGLSRQNTITVDKCDGIKLSSPGWGSGKRKCRPGPDEYGHANSDAGAAMQALPVLILGSSLSLAERPRPGALYGCYLAYQIPLLRAEHYYRWLLVWRSPTARRIYQVISICPLTLLYDRWTKSTQLSSYSNFELTKTEEDVRSPSCRFLDLQSPASPSRLRSSLFFPESVPTTCCLVIFFPIVGPQEGDLEESQRSSDKQVPYHGNLSVNSFVRLLDVRPRAGPSISALSSSSLSLSGKRSWLLSQSKGASTVEAVWKRNLSPDAVP